MSLKVSNFNCFIFNTKPSYIKVLCLYSENID